MATITLRADIALSFLNNRLREAAKTTSINEVEKKWARRYNALCHFPTNDGVTFTLDEIDEILMLNVPQRTDSYLRRNEGL